MLSTKITGASFSRVKCNYCLFSCLALSSAKVFSMISMTCLTNPIGNWCARRIRLICTLGTWTSSNGISTRSSSSPSAGVVMSEMNPNAKFSLTSPLIKVLLSDSKRTWGLCQPVLMKLYLESNSFTNRVLFFDFDFEFNLNSINKVLPVLVTICGSFDLLDFTVHTFYGTI